MSTSFKGEVEVYRRRTVALTAFANSVSRCTELQDESAESNEVEEELSQDELELSESEEQSSDNEDDGSSSEEEVVWEDTLTPAPFARRLYLPAGSQIDVNRVLSLNRLYYAEGRLLNLFHREALDGVLAPKDDEFGADVYTIEEATLHFQSLHENIRQ